MEVGGLGFNKEREKRESSLQANDVAQGIHCLHQGEVNKGECVVGQISKMF